MRRQAAIRLVRLARHLLEAAELNEAVLKQIQHMTDQNLHSEAIAALFRDVLRDRIGTKAAEALVELHKYFGGAEFGVYEAQHELRERGLAMAKMKFGPEDYERIYQSF